jgi:hypothetical protein
MAVRVGSTVVLGVSVFVYAFLFLLLATVGPREPSTPLGTNTPLGGVTRTATITKTPTPQRSPTPFSTLGPTPGQFGGVNNGGTTGGGPVILPPTRVIPVDTVAPTFTQDIRDDDQDGILNTSDNCSNDPGPSSNGGCPIDSDGDGLLVCLTQMMTAILKQVQGAIKAAQFWIPMVMALTMTLMPVTPRRPLVVQMAVCRRIRMEIASLMIPMRVITSSVH